MFKHYIFLFSGFCTNFNVALSFPTKTFLWRGR